MLYDLVVLACLIADPSHCQPLAAYKVAVPVTPLESIVSCQIMQVRLEHGLQPPVSGTFIKVLCKVEGERGV